MQAVILAGGLGTRLRPFTLSSPKPLFPIQGKPYIEYLLEQVKGFGIERVVLLLGYMAESIIDQVESNPLRGLEVKCHVTPPEYDTGARIKAASDLITEDFILLYCDNYCPINFEKHKENFNNNKAMVQLMAYSNRDGYTKNNLTVIDGFVTNYDKSRTSDGLNAVDIGYAIISHHLLNEIPEGKDVNFESVIYEIARLNNRLYASITEHRYYSIGSYERISLTEQFFSERKAVFLDRDGTINKRPPKACYVENEADFIWLPRAREAIKILNDAGILVILVSNQPGIARGRLTEEQLKDIHDRMERDLEGISAHLDKIYYCPHNWDDGCFCRKPQPGLLYKAQREFDLNIPKNCVLFGDDERDIDAANRADCRSFLVTEQNDLYYWVSEYLKEV